MDFLKNQAERIFNFHLESSCIAWGKCDTIYTMPKIDKDKLKFRDLGMEERHPDIADSSHPKVVPTVRLTEEQIPELAGKNELKTECHLYVILEMTGHREPEDFDISKHPIRDFDMTQAAYIATKEPGKEIKYVEGYEDAT